MKIIEEGRRQLWYVGKLLHCMKCGCCFELEAGDEPMYAGNQRDPGLYRIKCPQCNVDHFFNKKY